MKHQAPDSDVHQIRRFVADTTGLDFPESRWSDLRRGIAAAATELGYGTSAEYTARLTRGLSATNELELLVNHLTVGETYFFRERRSFEILADQILPALIRARRDNGRRLRIWSAACCTGEEPYSIAILLRRVIPDWEAWNITLLATDINSRFLRKAVAGEFGEWSFRDAPSWLRQGYFRPTDNGRFEVVPEIKRIVRFAKLNLADDAYPLPENDTHAMDVIFCRNVLMYFTEAQAIKVIQRLHRSQSDGGWLCVGVSESPGVPHVPYVAANGHGSSFYQKSGEATRAGSIASEMIERAPVAEAGSAARNSGEPQAPPSSKSPQTSALGELAASFADQGKLPEALERCDQWIAADKLNSASHCLRAVIMQEKGELDEAVRSLRTALYLDPNCVRAHFALGNIARKQGERAEAARHLKNARRLVCSLRSDDPLPECGGVTAGRFLQIVDSLIEMEAVA